MKHLFMSVFFLILLIVCFFTNSPVLGVVFFIASMGHFVVYMDKQAIDRRRKQIKS